MKMPQVPSPNINPYNIDYKKGLIKMFKAPLDPDFRPAAVAVAEYKKAVSEAENTPLVIAVERQKGYTSTFQIDVFKSIFK